MYWPIGAPRVYASSNSKTRKGQIFRPDDDADSHPDSGSEPNALISSSDTVRDANETASGFLTPSTPITLGIKPVENDGQRRLSARGLGSIEDKLEDFVAQPEGEHIISLKISRSGHLFAVITSTSLTIWQTKVRNYILSSSYCSFSIAYCHIICRGTFCFIASYIWPQRLLTCSTRLGHFRRTNDQRLPHHLLLSIRSQYPRIQTTFPRKYERSGTA
jgi:hypothetical protein